MVHLLKGHRVNRRSFYTMSTKMEEKEYTTGSDGIKIIRKRTEAETQVLKRKIAGKITVLVEKVTLTRRQQQLNVL